MNGSGFGGVEVEIRVFGGRIREFNYEKKVTEVRVRALQCGLKLTTSLRSEIWLRIPRSAIWPENDCNLESPIKF